MKDIIRVVVHFEPVEFSFIPKKLSSLAHNFAKSTYSIVSGIGSNGSFVSMTPPWCLFVSALLYFVNDISKLQKKKKMTSKIFKIPDSMAFANPSRKRRIQEFHPKRQLLNN